MDISVSKEFTVCKDCKHFINLHGAKAECRNYLVRIDPVWGSREYEYCADVNVDGCCGAFEKKRPSWIIALLRRCGGVTI